MMKSTKLFAVLLAVFMLLSLVPAAVFADAYKLTIDENTEHGSVSAASPVLEEIESGTEVTLNVAPERGYEIDEITVTDEEGNDLKEETEFKKVEEAAEEDPEEDIEDNNEEEENDDEGEAGEEGEEGGAGEDLTEKYTFIMPEKNVIVSASFKEVEPQSFSISLEENVENGSAKTDVEEAKAGDTVKITLTPENGYKTDEVSVKDTNENEVELSKVSANVYTFKMPESDVTVYFSFKEKSDTPYSITINENIKHGNVSVKKAKAVADTKVVLEVDPDQNYKLGSLTVTDDDDNKIKVKEDDDDGVVVYSFVMPESDVTVSAKFVEGEKYDIKIDKPTHGSISTDMSSAHEDEKVTISISAKSGYTIKKVYVYYEDEDEEEVSVKVSGTGTTQRTFKMPAADVTIEAEFRASESSSDSSSSSSTKTSSGSKTSGSTKTNYNTNTNSNTNNNSNGKKALPFNDVKDDDWFIEDVRYAYDNNLMKGVTDDTFAPSADTTRAMIVTILYRIEGEPEVYTANPFTDVAEDAWYANAIKWASGFGIVKGITDTEFAPDATITREQFAAILYRYAQYKGYDTEEEADISGYEDEAEVQEYAVKPLRWAVAKSFINGITKTSLAPRGNASRAQASAILHRIKNAIK
ncbi:MAG: S-layer homology domain-containing protein [Clostridia bacterium]|nr:S-layer homology domain-containing protein [Clostridia bacterium]